MTVNFGQSIVYDPVVGAVSYEFQLKNATLGEDLVSLPTTEPTISAAVLLNGLPHAVYYVRCRAFDDAGEGAWSELLALEFTALPAPTNGRVE